MLTAGLVPVHIQKVAKGMHPAMEPGFIPSPRGVFLAMSFTGYICSLYHVLSASFSFHSFLPYFFFYVIRYFEMQFTFPLLFIVLCLQPILYISEDISYQALPFRESHSFHIQIKKLKFVYIVLLNHRPGEVGESFHAG